MTTKCSIYGLGEILWDTFSTGRRLGGAPLNFAYHCTQLGFSACPVSCLGRDELGSEARSTLVEMGLFLGQGAVIWVFISEIFPNRNRAAGQALGSFTHWLFAASLTFVFPMAVAALSKANPAAADSTTGINPIVPTILFGFFCFMMVLQLLWVKFMVPETKGIALEDMQKALEG